MKVEDLLSLLNDLPVSVRDLEVLVHTDQGITHEFDLVFLALKEKGPVIKYIVSERDPRQLNLPFDVEEQDVKKH